jgi:type VI secretion system FHA domain protein
MKLTLSITAAPSDSALTGQQFVIDQNPASLGRKPDNQCQLPDSERIISSHHATINLVDQQFILTDTSTNGTFVNGSAIALPTPLKSGDIINIGKYSFSTNISSAQTSSTGPGSFLDELNPAGADIAPLSAPQKDDLASLFSAGTGTPPPPSAFDDIAPASNIPPQSNAADDLDRWLEPDLQPPSQQGLKWDSQNKEALSNLLGDEETDPLAILDQAAEKVAPGNIDDLFGDDDPDWWNASQADNASALNHAIDSASLLGNKEPDEHDAIAGVVHHAGGTSKPLANDTSKPLANNASKPLANDASKPLANDASKPLADTPSTSDSDPSSAFDDLLKPNPVAPDLDLKENNSPWEIADIEPQSIDDFLDSDEPASHPLLEKNTTTESSLPGIDSPSSGAISNLDESEQTTPGLGRVSTAIDNNIHDTAEFDHVDIEKPVDISHNQITPPEPDLPGFDSDSPDNSTAKPAQLIAESCATQTAQDLADQLGIGSLSEGQLNQLIPEVSAILQETTSRLLEVLIARSSVKNEMRLERTMIKSKENNPLKFSVSGEDALKNILNPRSEAFLSGKAAIKEAFDDLADHQMALLAGMQQAYEAMLNSFAPESLEERFPSASSRLIPGNKKARNWEAYQEYFVKLQSDKENAYNELFGGNFTKAYEDQIAFLKKQRQKH